MIRDGSIVEMRYRSYKRWGFKDPKPEDSYWLMDTHPMYMEQARTIDPYVWIVSCV